MSALTRELYSRIEECPAAPRGLLDVLKDQLPSASSYFKTEYFFKQRHVLVAMAVYGNSTLRSMLTAEELDQLSDIGSKLLVQAPGMANTARPLLPLVAELRNRGIM